MNRSRVVAGARAAILAAIAFGAGYVFSQATGPQDTKGSTTKALGQIDLAQELDSLAGRQLRARAVTVEAGGHVAAHGHQGRPTLEYVLQGDIIEIRNGVEIPHHAGDLVVATHDVSHWWENRSTAPAVLLPVDVFKPQ
jgi:quercetin dioxygenase-like cupin family protein